MGGKKCTYFIAVLWSCLVVIVMQCKLVHLLPVVSWWLCVMIAMWAVVCHDCCCCSVMIAVWAAVLDCCVNCSVMNAVCNDGCVSCSVESWNDCNVNCSVMNTVWTAVSGLQCELQCIRIAEGAAVYQNCSFSCCQDYSVAWLLCELQWGMIAVCHITTLIVIVSL